MGFNFVKFTETDSSFAAGITIRQTGQFGFNIGAMNRFKIGDYKFCILYFDPDRRVVGLEFSNTKADGSIDLKTSKANTYVRAKNFCDRFGVDYSKSHRYELKKDKDSGYLYFALDEEQTDETDDEDSVNTDVESNENCDENVTI